MPTTEGQRMLARNVWKWREIRRISASCLAERLGWQLPYIEAIERAEDVAVTLEHVDQLAVALEISPVDLFWRDVH